MNKILKEAWHSFQYTIAEIDDQSTPIDIFQRIKEWYTKNKNFLSPDLVEKYRLGELLDIEVSSYPLDKSECTPRSVKNILSIEPSSEDSLIMILRDQLWELVVLAVDSQCPRCGKLDMSALFDTTANKVVLECTQCGLLQTLIGCMFEPSGVIRLANNDELKIAGLIAPLEDEQNTTRAITK